VARNVYPPPPMNVASRLMAAALATLVIAGCSHGTVSELPAAPTGTVSMTSLTVTPVGGGTMIVGASAPITSSGGFPSTGAVLGAFAQYSDGSGKYVEARWTSSDDNVIAIDNAALSARGRGTATITAAAEGRTAAETFIVEPGIAGTWSGTFVVDTCQAGSGSAYELLCFPPNQGRTPGMFAVGAVQPLTMVIAQSGKDLSATVQFGELRGTLRGTDRGQNFLTLSGDLAANTTTLTLVHWDARVRTDAMEGFVGFEVRIAGLPSWAAVTAHFDKVTRR
jgi:hypothetical protein